MSNYKLFLSMMFFFLCIFPNLEAKPGVPALGGPTYLMGTDFQDSQLPFDNPDVLISMDFQDANLKDILKIFSIQSGLNFIASDAVKDRKLTLYFEGVPIRDALDKIFKANNLAYELDTKSNIFIVKDLGAPELETVTKVFYLKFASVSTSSLMTERNNTTTITSISGAGGGGSSSGSTSSSGSSSSNSSSSSSDSSGSASSSGTTKSGITEVVTKLLSSKGKVIEDPRTNSLIVTDIPTRMTVIANVITAIDVSQPQVLLEVEMVDVYKDTTDKIGLKYGTSPLTLNTVLKGASWGSKFPLGSLLGDRQKNFVDGSFAVSDGSTSAGVSTYQIVMDFIKTQTGTKFLARPKILTLNNETAEIKISANEAVGVSTTTSSNSGTVNASAERAETGVMLRVTPQINLETNEITMFVIPAVGESSTGGTFNISGTTSVSFKDPEIRYTRSMVRAKDGETIVIGGLIRRQFSETITKLPVLGDVPMLGAFFRHRNKDKDKDRELLVFITPHIIRDKAVQLAKAKTNMSILPEREQNVFPVVDRQAEIVSKLQDFEDRTQ